MVPVRFLWKRICNWLILPFVLRGANSKKMFGAQGTPNIFSAPVEFTFSH
jgi:hypothetical protein